MTTLDEKYESVWAAVGKSGDHRTLRLRFEAVCEKGLLLKAHKPDLVGMGYQEKATRHYKGMKLDNRVNFVLMNNLVVVLLEVTRDLGDLTLISLVEFEGMYKGITASFTLYYDFFDDVNLVDEFVNHDVGKVYERNFHNLLKRIEVLE